jgi:hypothetical protein
MKQLTLQGVTPFANTPIDAPDAVVTACKSEAQAVRECLAFARVFGVTRLTVAKLCGWKRSSFLSEIASEGSGKNMPPKRIRKFTLATGNRLLEQYHERQEAIRALTGKQTDADLTKNAVAAMVAAAHMDRRTQDREAA